MTAPVVALTGATGFVGGAIAGALRARGISAKLLCRRGGFAPPDGPGEVEIVKGALEDPAALAQLCDGASAVIHCAGLVKARSKDAFVAVNAEGARAVADAARNAGAGRFVLISSLSARAPDISDYAASKAAGEEVATDALNGSATDLAIVRPPAVYGPGDEETWKIFDLARRGVLPAPGGAGARFSLITASDLARFIVETALAAAPHQGAIYEPDDGKAGGYGWAALAEAASRHLDRPVRTVPLPRGVLVPIAAVAAAAVKATGSVPIFTAGKARELSHPDWVCRGAPYTLSPRTDLQTGIAQTFAWARETGRL